MIDIDIKNNSTHYKFHVMVHFLEWTKKAMNHANNEEYEKAKQIYSDLIKAVESNYASLYCYRGYVNFELGLLQEAIVDFKKALLIEPENTLTLDGLKMCLESVGDNYTEPSGKIEE